LSGNVGVLPYWFVIKPLLGRAIKWAFSCIPWKLYKFY
jgi:hypothetical protein